MTTKLNSKYSPAKKSQIVYSLQEIKKKTLQNKKNIMHKTLQKSQNKTSPILQVPPINFLAFHKSQTPTQRNIKTFRYPVRHHTPKQGQGLFTKFRQIPTQRVRKVSTNEDSDPNKYLTILRDFMVPHSMAWKKVDGKLQKLSCSLSVRPVGNNFLQSFRVVFSELIENYFIQVSLKKKIHHLKVEIWNYILKKADIQIGKQKRKLHYHQVDKKTFCIGLKNIFHGQFTSSLVSAMVAKYFSYESIVFYSQLEQILSVQNDCTEDLIQKEYEKRLNSLDQVQMVKLFLKKIMLFADLEKKLQMICGANENQVVKFLFSMNPGNLLETLKLAIFLVENEKLSPLSFKIIQRKVVNFMQKVMGQKLTKFQLMKWLNLHQKLLQ